jgi:hypothetical protein
MKVIAVFCKVMSNIQMFRQSTAALITTIALCTMKLQEISSCHSRLVNVKSDDILTLCLLYNRKRVSLLGNSAIAGPRAGWERRVNG